jgi:hypothetical protein
MVQETYHQGNTNAPQWQSQYCWPEGFMRRWHEFAVWEHYIMVTPDMVQILAGVARNFITNIHIGREFNMEGAVPRLGADVPRWYGETIGFWDNDTLITWTSNIQGWISHGIHEYSSYLQSIEIYTPMHDADGAMVGLKHEIILYDPEAFVEPVRVVQWLDRVGNLSDGEPFPTDECIPASFPINGETTPVAPGRTVEYIVPDIYRRPWAEIWERYYEEGMSPPEDDIDIFDFGQ